MPVADTDPRTNGVVLLHFCVCDFTSFWNKQWAKLGCVHAAECALSRYTMRGLPRYLSPHDQFRFVKNATAFAKFRDWRNQNDELAASAFYASAMCTWRPDELTKYGTYIKPVRVRHETANIGWAALAGGYPPLRWH